MGAPFGLPVRRSAGAPCGARLPAMDLNHDRRGRGEPLVLLHGIGSRWQVWEPVLDRLAERHDVLAVDMPGFGASPPLSGTTDIARLTDAVQTFAGAQGLERWHVAGNSTGGGVALELAARGAVVSATGISPIGFWSRRERIFCQRTLGASRAAAGLVRAAGGVPALVRSATGRRLLFSQTFAHPERMTAQEAVDTVEAFVGCPAYDDVSAAFTGYLAPREHGTVPVTILWGDRDLLLLPRQGRRARAVLPRARHVALAGCGHVPFLDDPQAVTAAMLGATDWTFTRPAGR